jgi:hypothetical protein
MKIFLVAIILLTSVSGRTAEAKSAERAPDFDATWQRVQRLVQVGKLQQAAQETGATLLCGLSYALLPTVSNLPQGILRHYLRE